MVFDYKSLLGTVAMMASVMSASADSASVTIVLKSGENKKVEMQESGAVFFSDNKLNLLPSSESSETLSYGLGSVQKLLFSTFDVGVVRVLSEGEILAYPNPATDNLFIANIPSSVKRIRLSDMSGKIVFETSGMTGPINVSTLPKGIYIVDVDGVTAKFEKK